jgi:hypothetical protein
MFYSWDRAGYDFAVYGALAENIGAAFFPSECDSPSSQAGNGTAANASTMNTTIISPQPCVDHNLIEVSSLPLA